MPNEPNEEKKATPVKEAGFIVVHGDGRGVHASRIKAVDHQAAADAVAKATGHQYYHVHEDSGQEEVEYRHDTHPLAEPGKFKVHGLDETIEHLRTRDAKSNNQAPRFPN